ncbi:MAG: flavodoxin domain-containing protein [Candidatus Bathyarchaeota archaeon]|nr:flavodoxin domain-containing protein [Candidatus Bathyarchaeota archaeon]
MAKVFIFYDSKYGNTKQAAKQILEGIRSEGVEADMGYIKDASLQTAEGYDAIVLGAPNHMGRPSRAMKRFVESLALADLKAKSVAVFGTYSGRVRLQDRAEKKLEKLAAQKLPKLKQLTPGLSVRVKGVTGPLAEGELPRCFEFGKKVAAQLKT